jgi:hypothetical protein
MICNYGAIIEGDLNFTLFGLGSVTIVYSKPCLGNEETHSSAP